MCDLETIITLIEDNEWVTLPYLLDGLSQPLPPTDPSLLMRASAAGAPGTVIDALLAVNLNPNEQRDGSRATALHFAARANNTDAAKLLAAAGADVNARTTTGDAPLHLAAQADAAQVVAVLASAGADVDATNSCGNTPLILAADVPAPAAARALVLAGASCEAVDEDGVTPAALAARAGDWELARELTPSANVAKIADNDGHTLLYAAIEADEHDFAAWLVDLCPQLVNMTTNSGWTPLMIRAAKNAELTTLLNAGAKADHAANDGTTPLMIVSEARNAPAARLLLAAGAPATAADATGRTAAHYAIAQLKRKNPVENAPDPAIEVLKELLAAGARADAEDGAGISLLAAAAAADAAEAVQLLVEAGADVNARRRASGGRGDGFTALHYAAQTNSLSALRALLAAGAAVEAETPEGVRPVEVAGCGGFAEAVQLLVEAGASEAEGKEALERHAMMLAEEEGEEKD